MTSPTQLPDNLELARTTPVFDETTVPAGLLSAHRIAEGVWGRLVVHSGALDFVFEDALDEVIRISANEGFVIPPLRSHRVVVDQAVSFAVEFHRIPDL